MLQRVGINGIEVSVSAIGSGRPVILLHGWPNTHALWRDVAATLRHEYSVIAPDLRGIGATTKASSGYDLHTLADDVAALIDAFDADGASLVATDISVPIAWMLAMRRPEIISRLILVEGLIGTLPGVEQVFKDGRPWWFGFHEIPGLAESIVVDHEEAYLCHFYEIGSRRGISPGLRAEFVTAYRGYEALRCGFQYYRGVSLRAQQIAEATENGRLEVPTLTIGGSMIKDALYRQLLPLADDLTGEVLEDSGHIVPVDQPDRLAQSIARFVRR